MRLKKPDFTADEFRQMVHYCPETGEFTWKVSDLFSNGRNAQYGGKKAGSIDTEGYVIVVVNRTNYKGHRLAWYYMTGDWPDEQIDHRDTVRSNNIWTNLRLATNQMNQFNKGPNKNNRSGIKGIFPATANRRHPWMAKIVMNGEKHHLGYFSSKEEAAAAYSVAAQHFAGAFARTGSD